MKSIISKSVTLLFVAGILNPAYANNGHLHTEDNEIVCELNDLLETRLFVDYDKDLDGELGVLSTKVIEMPTKNAYYHNGRLFRVELIKVVRMGTSLEDTQQVIIFKSEGDSLIINKLEVTTQAAKLTRNVNEEGQPLEPSFVDTGSCRLNEVE